ADRHKRFICSFSGCSAAYNRQWKLDAHLCKHTGVKPFACPQPGCGSSFCSRYHLERHELTHNSVKPFPCTVDGCGQAFTTNGNRDRHVSSVHEQGNRTYACKFEGCGQEFRKNKQLKAHMCEQHTQQPPYKCSHEGCHMRFTVPSKLKRHEKVHRGYPCTEQGCDFTGKTWTELLKHRRDAHRPVFKCDKCNKEFRDTWFLKQHERVHSDFRVVLKCPWEDCDRSFTTAFNLQSHISSFHEELRPYACPHEGCGRTFAMKRSMQRHSIVHDPERKKLTKPRPQRPKRSLASRLSGFDVKTAVSKKPKKADPPSPVELASLLHDTALLCSPAVDTQGLADALTAPLTV
uniref:Transcription factor IIIA n=1 Tax=Salarias fasciatus TaxID=181472 RepID=A0A672G4A1_SALFA